MHASGLDKILWILVAVGNILLLGVLFSRRLYRTFPVFSIFILWDTISDPLLLLVLFAYHGAFNQYYFHIYYAFSVLEYVLELGVLLEIAANVIRPASRSFPKGLLLSLLGTLLAAGLASFFFAAHASEATLAHHRTFVVMDTTVALLRLAMFLLIAGFSQVLGLSWRSHVLQLSTGLALYSIVMLIVKMAQSQLHGSPDYYQLYKFWGQVGVVGYLCTLYFWFYAFVKKEAPRKEFSPQMTKILVSLSGSTERQRAALARTRDQ